MTSDVAVSPVVEFGSTDSNRYMGVDAGEDAF